MPNGSEVLIDVSQFSPDRKRDIRLAPRVLAGVVDRLFMVTVSSNPKGKLFVLMTKPRNLKVIDLSRSNQTWTRGPGSAPDLFDRDITNITC